MVDVISRAGEWASRTQRGMVRTSSLARLEVGYSARSSADLRAAVGRPPLSSMPVEYMTPAIEERAMAVQQLLADQGHQRAPSVPDLLIAATAELARLVVLHLDRTSS